MVRPASRSPSPSNDLVAWQAVPGNYRQGHQPHARFHWFHHVAWRAGCWFREFDTELLRHPYVPLLTESHLQLNDVKTSFNRRILAAKISFLGLVQGQSVCILRSRAR